jgi:hypothetical protein
VKIVSVAAETGAIFLVDFGRHQQFYSEAAPQAISP